LAAHKPTEALEALDNGKQAIQESSEDEAYTYWRAVCLSVCGRHAEALAGLDQHSNARWFPLAKLSILRSQEQNKVELTNLAESIGKIWSLSNDDRLLLELCELKAAIGDWNFVIEHGDRLLSCTKTDAALLLYAAALHNVRHFKDCLEVLSANASLFPGQLLPPRFLAIRAASERALGLIPKALTDVEEAVRREPSLENINQLLQLKLDYGDQAGLVVTGRRLLGMKNASADTLIRLSRSICSYDPQAARSFLEAAIENGAPDTSIGLALDAAYGLLGAPTIRKQRSLSPRL
jgi:tetratricopeptide (TPR) repeat protein